MKTICKLGLAFALLAPLSSIARADDIDLGLQRVAPKILDYLRSKKYKNVGVLKFEVQRQGEHGKSSMLTGRLNSSMATRLENALILNNVDDSQEIGITRNAGRAAAGRDPKANYFTREGREKLLSGTYPLAWGDQQVKVDAFLTGKVTIQPDFQKALVVVRIFEKDDPTIRNLILFDAKVTRTLLTDLNQPFAFAKRALTAEEEDILMEDSAKRTAQEAEAYLQTIMPAKLKQPESEKKAVYAQKPKETILLDPEKKTGEEVLMEDLLLPQKEKLPLVTGLGGIAKKELEELLQFEIYYDGQLVPWKDGRVAFPQPGQKVRFKAKAKERLGLVLLVNGINTADFEKNPREPHQYSQWVLEPGRDYTIRGFYPSLDKVFEIEAVPYAEAMGTEFRSVLGDSTKIGQIELHVFREYPKAAEPKVAGPAYNLRGVTGIAKTLPQARGQIKSGVQERQIMVPKNLEEANLEIASFHGYHAGYYVIQYFKGDEVTYSEP